MRRSPRLALLERAFTNWRAPGYLSSIAYRIRPISPSLFTRLMERRFVLRTREGASLEARLRDVSGPAEVFGDREYAHEWLDWPTIESVVDLGAHVGGFALWAASQSRCRIACFEPNPEARLLLAANVSRMGLSDRIHVFPYALAGGRGRRRLHSPLDSVAAALDGESNDQGLEVETMGLEDVIAESGFSAVDLLKVDVEGAEFEAFAALGPGALAAVSHCVVECHPKAGASSELVADALRSEGFEVTTLAKPQGLQLLVARRTRGSSGA